MADPASLTAREAARQIDAGVLDPITLIDAYIDTIKRRESEVQAFAHFDPAAARAAAAECKAGPLRGIPIGVKDVLDTADMPSAYGSSIWQGWQPKSDSAPVTWAKVSGGVVI